MSDKAINYSIDNGIARVTFCNPQGNNVIGLQFTREFADVAMACEIERDLRAVSITAEGDRFSVGGNLNEFLGQKENIRNHVREMATFFHLGISIFDKLEAPIITSVNGMAAGGGMSIVCMSDLAIATKTAKFNLAYTRTGLTPDGGSTWFLPRLVGMQRAYDIMVTNPTLDAEEAKSLGLVARVVEDENLESETEDIIESLMSLPANAAGRTKRLLRHSLRNRLETQLELESRQIAESVSSSETMNSLESFFNR